MTEQPVRILIIDDNIGDVRLLIEALREECPGCEIDHVDNGELAVDYLQQKGEYAQRAIPELIILDLNMPRLDGHEVLRVIRSTPRLSSVTVVVFSSSPHEIARATLIDPSKCFQKPFDLDQFLSLAKDIFRHFGRKEAAAE